MAAAGNITILPIVLAAKGLHGKHIVTFVIDTRFAYQIFYFDPAGYTINDNAERKVDGYLVSELTHNQGSLTDLAEELSVNFGVDTIFENITPYQTDAYNCGVFYLKLLESLLNLPEEKNLDTDFFKTTFETFDPTQYRKDFFPKFSNYFSEVAPSAASSKKPSAAGSKGKEPASDEWTIV